VIKSFIQPAPGLKQYLPKKPHKWGIKVWASCGVSGIVYDFQIYTGSGSGSDNDDPNLGVGGNVVRHLTSSLPENVGHKEYFDNYFSSVYLSISYPEQCLCAG
jgi:hypothetical protein